ncbi:MAG TPA: thiamine phosphate synthase [Candidatus Brocadiales bacterium]|nr:thiamine phosphate synthase [Candidatus Brocadiales bacterium]
MTKKERLSSLRLYVLISSNIASMPVIDAAKLVIEGGADAIQMREKDMDDDAFLTLAGELRELTSRAGIIFTVNDRTIIAKKVDADGVHLGQYDASVHDARNVLGEEKIIGVSTHSIEQARKAVLDGADYISAGPVYSTMTKPHEPVAGLGYISEVAREIEIPFFAIGSITIENLEDVLKAGASRVAVCSAIIGSRDIAKSTRTFKDKLLQFCK